MALESLFVCTAEFPIWTSISPAKPLSETLVFMTIFTDECVYRSNFGGRMNRAGRTTSFLLCIVVLWIICTAVSAAEEGRSGTLTDPRDGDVYKWVRIGDQIWMAENLRFEPDSGSWCWENKEENCATRGRLYDWSSAMKAAPPGWHIPSDAEWKKLEIALGLTAEQADQEGMRLDNDSIIAGKVKSKGAWPEEHDGVPLTITNASGFSAVMAGFHALGEFTHDGYAAWWSSTDVGEKAWIRHIGFSDNTFGRTTNRKKFGFSVRCVRDPE